jgi:hypothetical protein
MAGYEKSSRSASPNRCGNFRLYWTSIAINHYPTTRDCHRHHHTIHPKLAVILYTIKGFKILPYQHQILFPISVEPVTSMLAPIYLLIKNFHAWMSTLYRSADNKNPTVGKGSCSEKISSGSFVVHRGGFILNLFGLLRK